MATYAANCTNCGPIEVSKPMADAFPARHACGGKLTRLYSAPPAVHYASAGFYSTDVSRLQKIVGTERYAKFEHERDAAVTRAATGTQTPYERALERVNG